MRKSKANAKQTAHTHASHTHTRTHTLRLRWQVSRIKFNWIWVFTSGTSRRAKPQAAPPSCSSSFVWLLPMRPTFLHCVCVCVWECVSVGSRVSYISEVACGLSRILWTHWPGRRRTPCETKQILRIRQGSADLSLSLTTLPRWSDQLAP